MQNDTEFLIIKKMLGFKFLIKYNHFECSKFANFDNLLYLTVIRFLAYSSKI